MGYSIDFDNIVDENHHLIDGFIGSEYQKNAKWVIGRIMGIPSFKISKFV